MTELRAFGVVSMRTQNNDLKFVITSRVSSRTREDGEGPHERSMTARCSLCDPPACARSLACARDDKPRRRERVGRCHVYCLCAVSFFGWRFRSVICLIRAESDGLQVATSGSSLKAL